MSQAIQNVPKFIDHVKEQIESCIQKYMSLKETITYLEKKHHIRHRITTSIWEHLQRESPNFFNEYNKRCEVARQIAKFNILLAQQIDRMDKLRLIDHKTSAQATKLQKPNGQHYHQDQIHNQSNKSNDIAYSLESLDSLSCLTDPSSFAGPGPVSTLQQELNNHHHQDQIHDQWIGSSNGEVSVSCLYNTPPFDATPQSKAFTPFAATQHSDAFTPFAATVPHSDALTPFPATLPQSNAFTPFDATPQSNAFTPFAATPHSDAFTSFAAAPYSDAFTPLGAIPQSNAFTPFAATVPHSDAFTPFAPIPHSDAFTPFAATVPHSDAFTPFAAIPQSDAFTTFAPTPHSDAFTTLGATPHSDAFTTFGALPHSDAFTPFDATPQSNAFTPFAATSHSDAFTPLAATQQSDPFQYGLRYDIDYDDAEQFARDLDEQQQRLELKFQGHQQPQYPMNQQEVYVHQQHDNTTLQGDGPTTTMAHHQHMISASKQQNRVNQSGISLFDEDVDIV